MDDGDATEDALPSIQQAFQPAPERAGPDRAPENARQYLLDVTVSIYQGQLRVEWTYSSRLHRSSAIERLVNDYTKALREIINHCQSPEAGGYTPSDFADAHLTEQELEGLLAELGESE